MANPEDVNVDFRYKEDFERWLRGRAEQQIKAHHKWMRVVDDDLKIYSIRIRYRRIIFVMPEAEHDPSTLIYAEQVIMWAQLRRSYTSRQIAHLFGLKTSTVNACLNYYFETEDIRESAYLVYGIEDRILPGKNTPKRDSTKLSDIAKVDERFAAPVDMDEIVEETERQNSK